MNADEAEVPIRSRDYWFKVTSFLQENWALVDVEPDGAIVWFLNKGSGVIDRLRFRSEAEATRGLRHNGFQRFADDPEAPRYVRPPAPPFLGAWAKGASYAGGIYSSGKYWTR